MDLVPNLNEPSRCFSLHGPIVRMRSQIPSSSLKYSSSSSLSPWMSAVVGALGPKISLSEGCPIFKFASRSPGRNASPGEKFIMLPQGITDAPLLFL